jgi:hypothetical protein
VLVVLAHAGDASAHWAATRLRERGASPVEEVLVESLGAATTWQHELGVDGATTEIGLLDGRHLRTGEVTSVLNRMLQPPLAAVAAAIPGDADYARGELTAFAASWLRALAPVVVNEPTPQGLCGRWRAPLQWRALALAAGLPAAPTTFESASPPPLGYGFFEAAEPCTTVLMLGGELLDGEVPDAVRAAVRRFAALAETPILGLRFAGLERDRAEWRLLDATPYPDLSSGGEAGISALEELLAP